MSGNFLSLAALPLLALSAASVSGAVQHVPATQPAAIGAWSQFNVPVRMRDGVTLRANVFRPAAPGRYPAILLRTPYGKGNALTPNYESFVNHGYAVVVEDVRGRYDSGGVFEPINQEINDGDDTLNWIGEQGWSDGGVGMYGGSYLGIAQWKAALTHNPHLKAIFPYVSGDDDYRDRFYSEGGALKLGHRLLWLEENMREPGFRAPDFRSYVFALPERNEDLVATGQRLGVWRKVADHPTYDQFWKDSSVRTHLKDFSVPVYSVGGWYDNYVESDLDAFSILRKRNPEDRIMIGPWPHVFSASFEGVSFGKDSLVPLRPEQLKWFGRWLKDEEPGLKEGLKEGLKDKQPPVEEAPVRLFVMGVNQWRDEEEWPLKRALPTKFYLWGGHANSLEGDGKLGSKPERHAPASQFVYDPANPVPTRGGAVCCDPKVFPWGPMDQRPVEKRRDVLVYSTEPLSVDTEVTGPVKVALYASSTATDTDFTAKLVDVFPDGTARNLTDGLLRVRYRDSLEEAKLMEPGKVYRLNIDVGVTSNVFRAGHRIRLEISSSNFPRFDRNPNTGATVADARQLRKATQTVYGDWERHSYVLLPIVPIRAAELTSSRQPRYPQKSSPGSTTGNTTALVR
jgi:putative CocE/NonD family hydrolase